MIWLSFKAWSSESKHRTIKQRIYLKGKWTPFVRVSRRYRSNKNDSVYGDDVQYTGSLTL